MVLEHENDYSSRWQAICAVAGKIGCSPDSLKHWIRRLEVDQGQRDGTTTSDRERLKALEKENKELRRANEILKTAPAFFAQAEIDRRVRY
jgi:transposase